jgi:hypothetical protein
MVTGRPLVFVDRRRVPVMQEPTPQILVVNHHHPLAANGAARAEVDGRRAVVDVQSLDGAALPVDHVEGAVVAGEQHHIAHRELPAADLEPFGAEVPVVGEALPDTSVEPVHIDPALRHQQLILPPVQPVVPPRIQQRFPRLGGGLVRI